ncbi:MAG: hypothetical protein IJ458_02650 [Clostridia bacterium]|nr:hypothetical protein [Clostridia bacterium]
MKEEKQINPIEQILDENNLDNIVLYNEQDEPFEFEQIAIIPLENGDKQDLYAILLPLTPLSGIEEDEALVFEVNERENVIRVCADDEIIDRVMTEYERLLDESEVK